MSAARARRWTLAAIVTLVGWCALELLARRTGSITDDWQGWRQADTQAIARSFAFEHFDVLRPRIDWRGDGPGFVETELSLYPALAALGMRVVGESLWPAQLLSLAFVAGAVAVVAATLRAELGDRPAFLALVTMLAAQGTVVMATSIQPDALALLAFAVGLAAFLADLRAPSIGRLLLWVSATAIAGLVKPTTLELGLAQLALCALGRRDALRAPRIWLGWACVLAIVGAHLLHARGLYLAYGNTFGVLSGGDSKLPTAARLRDVGLWLELARNAVKWGIGAPALVALAYLLARRRLRVEEIALGLGALALSILAFRYMSGPFGTHYHLPQVALGGFLVARATHDLEARFEGGAGLARARIALTALTALVSLALFARAVRFVRRLPPEPESRLGGLLGELAAPGTLVAVRVRAPRFDEAWRTVNNFEDPRVFYLSRTRGWAIANDEPGAARLAELARRGARFYAHVRQKPIDVELAAWLAAHAERVAAVPEGAIYRLAAPPR